MKTITIQLPSKGLLYDKTHVLYGKESVVIKEMTASEEDILTSRDLIKSGKFLDELLRSCIQDKDFKENLDDMFMGDKNAVLFALRVTGLGKDYPVKIKCANCEKEYEYTFDLSKIQSTGIAQEEGTDISSLSNIFEFTTSDGDSIKFRLLTSKESDEITEQNERMKKFSKSDRDQLVTLKLKRMIVSINNKTEGHEISKFVENLKYLDSRALRKYADKITPDIKLDETVTCPNKDCKHSEVIDMPPINASFFWPSK